MWQMYRKSEAERDVINKDGTVTDTGEFVQ